MPENVWSAVNDKEVTSAVQCALFWHTFGVFHEDDMLPFLLWVNISLYTATDEPKQCHNRPEAGIIWPARAADPVAEAAAKLLGR